MFNFWLIKNYIKYKLFSRHKYGHGIHSPFVFDFIVNVLNKKVTNNDFKDIEILRKELKSNKSLINVTDLGAGSKKSKSNYRKIKDIAKYSVESRKNAELIYKICNYYNCKNVLELGTSLGITSCYIAMSNKKSINLTTIEGCKNIASIAQDNFNKLSVDNIKLIVNNFDYELNNQVKNNNFDLIYFDGNHKYKATIFYFNTALKYSKSNSIFIFDDIYWSPEMTKAWNEIKSNDKVKVSIDLFNLGIIFFKDGLSKQDFVIRY